MFYMTSDITIGGLKKVKPAKVVWKTDVNGFIDTCTIELPRISYLKNDKTNTEGQKVNDYLIQENDFVSVALGYDGRNEKRFEGFVKRVNTGTPLQVECEGYSYQLYDVVFSKTYTKTTVKELLTDVCQGTTIKLADKMPHIPLSNVRFKNAGGLQVLEWLQKECKLAVYFNFNELYVGTKFGKQQKKVKLKLGWNTIKDDDFKQRKIDKTTKIVIKEKSSTGEVKKTPADVEKYSNEKVLKIKQGFPSDVLKDIANRLQTKSNYKGYEGGINCFLEPYMIKGMLVEVDGYRYPEKSGTFFIESIEGEFSKSGGRQNIKLTYVSQ